MGRWAYSRVCTIGCDGLVAFLTQHPDDCLAGNEVGVTESHFVLALSDLFPAVPRNGGLLPELRVQRHSTTPLDPPLNLYRRALTTPVVGCGLSIRCHPAKHRRNCQLMIPISRSPVGGGVIVDAVEITQNVERRVGKMRSTASAVSSSTRSEPTLHYFTTVTGTGARRTTFSATLPSNTRAVPLRPWLPMYTASASSAWSVMTFSGSPASAIVSIAPS